jgi:hypothetical protein
MWTIWREKVHNNVFVFEFFRNLFKKPSTRELWNYSVIKIRIMENRRKKLFSSHIET